MIKRILLISADQRQALRAQLELVRNGLTVEIASSFRRGLAVACNRPLAAIVLDETLPGLDRPQLDQVLRAQPYASAIPVVTLTPTDAAEAPLLERQMGAAAPLPLWRTPEQRLVEALRQRGVL